MNRIENQINYYRRWKIFAPLGLTIIGLGVSLIGDSIILKANGTSFLRWFGMGTLALIILNSGIAVFGEAVKSRLLHEIGEKR